MIGWFEALILGLVQGLTEFLPISSSAHLRVTAALAGWEDPGAAFTAVTQLGTETAVLIYFRNDIVAIIRAWSLSLFRSEMRSDPNARMGWFVIFGSLPIAVLGLTFQHTIENTFRNLWLISTTLVVFAVLLFIADRIARNRTTLDEMTVKHAVLFGFAQALALIPGVSRSGGTITAGLLMGYRREAAARYSFLLALPAVYASGLLELTKIGGENTPPWGPTILATVVAFVVGYAAVAWLLRYISTHTFTVFVVYRIALGIVLFGLLGAGVLSATS